MAHCVSDIQVICVGQAVVDCITRGAGEDVFSGSGKPVLRAKDITLRTGGDAVTESFVLSSLGVRSALMCVLGRDIAGDAIMAEAEARGVDTSRISRDIPLSTPVADIIVREDGSRYSVNSLATLLPGYVPSPELVKGARVVSLASLFRAPLDDPKAVLELAKAAKQSGAVLCADTKLPAYRTLALEDMKEVLPLIDYIFPNEREAEHYTGKNTFPEMGKVLLDMGVGHVVIKAGPMGCFAMDEDGSLSLPALPSDVVDTTGAGDNFVAGFITGILDGVSFREMCERGLRQAAESIRHTGGSPALPR